MRDADRIREQSTEPQSWSTVIVTLAAVVGISGVFAMGYTMGRRIERLAPCTVPAAQATARTTERLDLERQTYNELTFYDALMADPVREPAAPAALPKAAASAVVAKKPPPSAKPAAPPPNIVQAPVAKPAAPKGSFTLQVSSVRRREEAQALATAMTRQGLHPYITAATIADRGTWYRVRVGHYDTAQAANAAKANLAQSDIPAWVLRID